VLVRNSGANSLNVYPHVGGQINSLGSNVAFALSSSATIEFISFNATQWYTTNATYA
jgi:hypothetical protein